MRALLARNHVLVHHLRMRTIVSPHSTLLVGLVVGLVVAACSNTSTPRGSADAGNGGDSGSTGSATDSNTSLGLHARKQFTVASLTAASQVDIPFTFSPERYAPHLRYDGVLCSTLTLDSWNSFPALIEIGNADSLAITLELYSSYSHVDALVVYATQPITSAALADQGTCVSVASNAGVSRYDFAQSVPSTFAIAPGNAIYVYAQRSEDLHGEEQSASISVRLATK